MLKQTKDASDSDYITLQEHDDLYQALRRGSTGHMTNLLTNNLRESGSLHVQHDGAFLYAGAQLQQAVQGQRRHVGFTPTLSSFLHLFLKLYPPAQRAKQKIRGPINRNT